MLVLVTYDVATVEAAGKRRLRRVAQACEDYGVRVQKSVFECPAISAKALARMQARIERIIHEQEDSVRYYLLCHGCGTRVAVTGLGLIHEALTFEVV